MPGVLRGAWFGGTLYGTVVAQACSPGAGFCDRRANDERPGLDLFQTGALLYRS